MVKDRDFFFKSERQRFLGNCFEKLQFFLIRNLHIQKLVTSKSVYTPGIRNSQLEYFLWWHKMKHHLMKQVIKPLRNSYEGVHIFLVYRPRTYVSENNFLDWVRSVWVLLMCTYGNKPSAIITTDKNDLKVNKPVYIAKLRQRYYKILNNILLHAPNHALKDA